MHPLTSRPVILCVDDDFAQLNVHAAVLSGAGYEVLTSTNAAAGLHLLTHNLVDLVISDHLIGDISGAVLLAEMKRIKPDVRVVLLSGLPDAPEGDFLEVVRKLLTGEELLPKARAAGRSG